MIFHPLDPNPSYKICFLIHVRVASWSRRVADVVSGWLAGVAPASRLQRRGPRSERLSVMLGRRRCAPRPPPLSSLPTWAGSVSVLPICELVASGYDYVKITFKNSCTFVCFLCHDLLVARCVEVCLDRCAHAAAAACPLCVSMCQTVRAQCALRLGPGRVR
jgi:hypothetical protein